jgi:energy-coupling factor transporter ATP-binding protein EcfA2
MLGFVAYASVPSDIAPVLEMAVEKANKATDIFTFQTWAENDIAGRPLIDPIQESIEESSFIIADISVLNFNVIFEIGYAIGQNRRVFLVRNKSISIDDEIMKRVGIFDTLGYETYSNSDELSSYLTTIIDIAPIVFNRQTDPKAKTWVLQTPIRTEAMTRIIAQVKKRLFAFRSFDPAEQSRMPAQETIDQIAASTGVIVPFLAEYVTDSRIHNLRGAFSAGLAFGMGKVALLLQEGDGFIPPLDVRDFVKRYKHPQDIDALIGKFKDDVESAYYSQDVVLPAPGALERLQLGAPTAENEFQTLASYFLKTDEFGRAIRGEVNLVIGRKGSGKTAVFSQVRNELRRNKSNVIIDLKPEGYQLIKLKDFVLKYLEAGSSVHLITAFWDYILLLEIAYKLLEKDQKVFNRDPKLYEAYQALQDIYDGNGFASDGDFSERLVNFSNHVGQSYASAFGIEPGIRLSADHITQILYRHDIKKLRKAITDYLALKEQVWILFDNIDKGWATHGVSQEDIIIVHSLIEALWKIERDMKRDGHDFHSLIFLRNDVYQKLVSSVPDRGKDIRVVLDWNDRGLLKELIRKRFIYNGKPEAAGFASLWGEFFTPKYHGYDSADYLIERCLMRPRYLLLLVNHCRGVAVNYDHHRVDAEDIERGMLAYSNDLVVETDIELRDVFPQADNLIYQFIGEEPDMLESDLCKHYVRADLKDDDHSKATDFLLWYGVLGVLRGDNKPVFIYDVGYDIKKLKILREKEGGETAIYRINPAFWPGLDIKDKGTLSEPRLL